MPSKYGETPIKSITDLTNVTLSVDKEYGFHFSRLVSN